MIKDIWNVQSLMFSEQLLLSPSAHYDDAFIRLQAKLYAIRTIVFQHTKNTHCMNKVSYKNLRVLLLEVTLSDNLSFGSTIHHTNRLFILYQAVSQGNSKIV